MSASLVGSEMCIRDSPAAGCRTPRRSPGEPGTLGSPTGLGGARALGPGPVSYTHLTLPTICSV
eukprot:10126544-Alexandrium_andersonii.AAC.1